MSAIDEVKKLGINRSTLSGFRVSVVELIFSFVGLHFVLADAGVVHWLVMVQGQFFFTFRHVAFWQSGRLRLFWLLLMAALIVSCTSDTERAATQFQLRDAILLWHNLA